MARKKIVAGNWKMNMTPSEAVKLCGELKDLVKSDSVDVVYCARNRHRARCGGREGDQRGCGR